MFARILAPVDGSDTACRALDKAIELQLRFDSELMIMTVFRHHSLLESSMSMIRASEPASLDEALRQHAAEVAENGKSRALAAGVVAPRAFTRRGPPARTIVSFAEDNEIDLIVLGRRGTGDLESYLLGSVSHKVTSLARCPVLVV